MGSLEGAVGYTNVPNSHGNHQGEGHQDGSHRDHGYHRRRDPSNRQTRQLPPPGPPSQNLPPSAPPSVSTITRGMETIRNVAPDAVYRGAHAVDSGAQYFAQGQPTGGSNVGANLGSNMDLGAVGNAPVLPPCPSRVMGQSTGSLSLGLGSGENDYYPEEINRLNRSQPSHGNPSGSQTPTGYFTDTASETSYGTGSSVSRASRLGGPRVNPPRGAMGGNPPMPQRGPGLVPNILNPINPNPQPQGNVVPQGNNAQPNVPQPANARPVPVNNPAPPQPQVLPPAYQDYRLDNHPATPQHLWPVQAQPVHHPQDNPPPYDPYDGGVPPYGQDPYRNPYRNPGGQGQDNPNWNIPGGYHPLRQYQGWNPMGPFLPRPRDPKLSKYDGSLSWPAYEVKLEHMANQYGWDDGTKLAKLVEALEGKALNYYGTLDEVIRGNYRLVRQKFNARFFPREPARTAHNQLSVLTQKDDEELEEFAERALRLSMDAWSDTSIETANQVAQEAFLHGVQDKEAALITMNRSPANLDEALETLKKIIHDKRSLTGRGKAAATKVVHNVSFGDQEDSSTVRVATVANSGSGGNANSTAMPKLEQEVKELANSVSQLITFLKEQHKSSDSPKSPQTPRAPGSPIICYKCGGRGHRRTECPTKSPGNATTQSPKLLNNNGLS